MKKTPCDKNRDLDLALDKIARMDRRSFLAFAAAGAAVGLMPGIPGSALANEVPQLNSINAAHTRVFLKMAEAALPVEDTKLAPWDATVLLQTLDNALLGTMEPHILAGLQGGLDYFNQGPVEQYSKTFVELSPEQAREFCDQWSDSPEPPRRALEVGIKKLVQLSYWANPGSWAATGYDGPVSDTWGLQPLGNAALPEA